MAITKSIILAALLTLGNTDAFFMAGPSAAAATQKSSSQSSSIGYIPDGLTAEQYKQIKQQERARTTGKNLGRLGPRGFKSRSMQAWQEAYERGEAQHEIAPFGYREMLKEGKLSYKDVPYMVRGGSWDNADVAKAPWQRRKWSKLDKEYARGGYKKEQSVSILGSGDGINWTGEKRESSRKNLMPGFS